MNDVTEHTIASTQGGIMILGLGPGDPELLTRQAWNWIRQADEIYLRTKRHPTVAGFPAGLAVYSFDDLYEQSQKFEEVYASIVDRVLELGRRPQGVTYAVPGSPMVAEATSPEILRRAREEGIPVRVVEGMSFLEPTFSAIGLDPFLGTALVDALDLVNAHVTNFPPSLPALICQIYSREVAAQVKLTLMEVYPDEHPVKLVHAAGTAGQQVEELALYQIDRSEATGLLTTLYLPPLGPDTSFEAFQEVIAHLRAPNGCPWDREQTHTSLRQHLLEETYEALAALDQLDYPAMVEEFGDLLLQIVLHAQIATEEGNFRMADILQGIHRKIVRRHPHVFGDFQVAGVSGVLANWEKLKAAERVANGKDGQKVKGLLDGVPLALPALTQAQEIQDRAARVGFDWKEIDGVLEKVKEEIDEIGGAPDAEALAGEIGDLFFAVVNVARWKKVDAESALRETNERFRKRFAFIEKAAREQGRRLDEMSFEEMDSLWEAAKKERGE
ncbi:MAG TPA: nucleoside triphosphate pyrophosphohydrolase [Anaerolineaceae bacterium]|nr:nucleoside triphosphate pyrophosphohydrolase [Anaerolineaceae bacterium]